MAHYYLGILIIIIDTISLIYFLDYFDILIYHYDAFNEYIICKSKKLSNM